MSPLVCILVVVVVVVANQPALARYIGQAERQGRLSEVGASSQPERALWGKAVSLFP